MMDFHGFMWWLCAHIHQIVPVVRSVQQHQWTSEGKKLIWNPNENNFAMVITILLLQIEYISLILISFSSIQRRLYCTKDLLCRTVFHGLRANAKFWLKFRPPQSIVIPFALAFLVTSFLFFFLPLIFATLLLLLLLAFCDFHTQ